MKRMMIRFFTGCVFIGLGARMTLTELGGWTLKDYREGLQLMPTQTFREEIYMLPDEGADYYKFELSYVSRPGEPEKKVVYDKNYTDTMLLSVDYKGTAPNVFCGTTYESGGDKYMFYLLDLSDFSQPSDIYFRLKTMFENKTVYQYFESCQIESVTIYTAYPDKIIM